MRLSVLTSVSLSLTTLTLSARVGEFSKSRDLPPLKLAAADLDTILHRTQALIAAANGPASDEESARESVKLGVGGHEIEIPHFSVASSVAFPREVFRFSYTYRRPDKPISFVAIDLVEYATLQRIGHADLFGSWSVAGASFAMGQIPRRLCSLPELFAFPSRQIC